MKLFLVALLVVGCGGVPAAATTQPAASATSAPTSAAIALASPTPGGDAWPQGWDEVVCLGFAHLGDARDSLKRAAFAAVSGDVEGMADRSDAAAYSARLAKASFDAAPNWKPGATMVAKFVLTATAYIGAAKLIKKAAVNLDPASMEDAVTRVEDGGMRLNEAVVAMATIPGFDGC